VLFDPLLDSLVTKKTESAQGEPNNQRTEDKDGGNFA
jgi:hypothetical protein